VSRTGSPGPAPWLNGARRADALTSARSHGDLRHRGGDALGRQRRHRLVADAARHDVAEVREVGLDVEGEAVHGPAPHVAHADRGDLAVVDPHARVVVDAAGAGEADVGQRVDHDLLEGVDVRGGVGDARLRRQREDRVADELAGAVVGDVATTAHLHELGADRRRGHEHVGEVGADAEGVGVRMLLEQQVVVRRPLEQRLLHRERVPVADPSDPADAEHR
jgi:hypothetical protein